jgi:hypothetical protein
MLVVQLYRNSLNFMKIESSFPCSQGPDSGSYPESTESSSYSLFWRSILISSSRRHLGLPNCVFPSGFLTMILYAVLISHMCPAWSLSLCKFFHSPFIPFSWRQLKWSRKISVQIEINRRLQYVQQVEFTEGGEVGKRKIDWLVDCLINWIEPEYHHSSPFDTTLSQIY